MLDIQKYKSSLLEFLELVEALDQPKWRIAEHLRFPASQSSTLSGSDLGRELWDQTAAQQLIDTLLEDENIGTWFGPDNEWPPESRLHELRAQLASFVHAWNAHQAPPGEIAAEWGDSLLRALRTRETYCSRARVLYGVQVTKSIEILPGLTIEPASQDVLIETLAKFGASAREALRIPRRSAVLVRAVVRGSRDDYRWDAATWAFAWTVTMVENVRWDIWLATGVLPRLGDEFVTEPSEFPVFPPERYPASYRESHAFALDKEDALIDAALLLEIHKRTDVLRGEPESFPEEAVAPLWVANTFMNPAIDSADSLMTVLLAYAGCEGLLREKEEDDSRFGPRLALPIGRDTAEQRRLRKVAARWMELRGFAAHGRRPPFEVMASFLEQHLTPEDLSGSLLGVEKIRGHARSRASTLFRRVFLAILFSCVTISDGVPRPSLTRDDVLEVLERAASGDGVARRQIASAVPQFVRDIGL